MNADLCCGVRNSNQIAEDAVDLAVIQTGRGFLDSTDQAELVFAPGAVGFLPTGSGPNEIDGEIGPDSIEPGGEAPLGIVPIEPLPGLDEGHLDDVPGLFVIEHDPRHRAVEPA